MANCRGVGGVSGMSNKMQHGEKYQDFLNGGGGGLGHSLIIIK